jgi:hypothetical protein
MNSEQMLANQKSREQRRINLVKDPSASPDYYNYVTRSMEQEERKDMLSRIEALELVVSFAKDVVDFWPNMSMKTIRLMIPKMAALKEALDLVK